MGQTENVNSTHMVVPGADCAAETAQEGCFWASCPLWMVRGRMARSASASATGCCQKAQHLQLLHSMLGRCGRQCA